MRLEVGGEGLEEGGRRLEAEEGAEERAEERAGRKG
jgi:hypothetical protein